jgi:hypothetical protein
MHSGRSDDKQEAPMRARFPICKALFSFGIAVAIAAFGASSPGPAPLATSDGEKAGTRIEVTELKRTSGGTLSLKFVVVNDSDKTLGFGYDFASPDNHIKDHATVGGITLVDPVNKKKYFVVRDAEDKCVCSSGVHDLPKSSRANLWAKFPAPPESVQKISIVVPHFAPMDDVPIAKP